MLIISKLSTTKCLLHANGGGRLSYACIYISGQSAPHLHALSLSARGSTAWWQKISCAGQPVGTQTGICRLSPVLILVLASGTGPYGEAVLCIFRRSPPCLLSFRFSFCPIFIFAELGSSSVYLPCLCPRPCSYVLEFSSCLAARCAVELESCLGACDYGGFGIGCWSIRSKVSRSAAFCFPHWAAEVSQLRHRSSSWACAGSCHIYIYIYIALGTAAQPVAMQDVETRLQSRLWPLRTHHSTKNDAKRTAAGRNLQHFECISKVTVQMPTMCELAAQYWPPDPGPTPTHMHMPER
jgi:hypothetical protein